MPKSRASTRRHRRLTVRILVDYEHNGALRREYATTLGAGGLFITSDDPPSENSMLKLRFCLAGSDELHELEGRVTWRRPAESNGSAIAPGMGVQFTAGNATSKLARDLNRLELARTD
jgi:uncharacterized protein (TIGR02266 family)